VDPPVIDVGTIAPQKRISASFSLIDSPYEHFDVSDVSHESHSVLDRIHYSKTKTGECVTEIVISFLASDELFGSNNLLKTPKVDLLNKQSLIVASVPVFARIEREIHLLPTTVTF